MIVIHIVNGRQPQNNSSLWPPGHKQLHTNVIIEISAGKAGKNRGKQGKTPKEEKRVGAIYQKPSLYLPDFNIHMYFPLI